MKKKLRGNYSGWPKSLPRANPKKKKKKKLWPFGGGQTTSKCHESGFSHLDRPI
jgi:hypothetical protein